MKKKPRPPWIGVVDNKRAPLIRATKMNVGSERLFVDFLFVDSHTKIDSNEREKFNRAKWSAHPRESGDPAKNPTALAISSGFPLSRE
jgi:hypothetical protein